MPDRIPVARGCRLELAFLAAGLAALWAGPHTLIGDGGLRYDALTRLLEHGDASAPRFSLVGPLASAPLWLAGQLIDDPRGATALFNVLLFTLALGLIARELRALMPPRAWSATLVLLLFGSMFPNHVQTYYGEVFSALATTLGVLWLARGRARLGWLALALGAVNTPATLLGVLAVALLAARRERSWLHLLGPAVALVLIGVENRVMRGGFLESGYAGDAGLRTVMPYSGQPGFSYPLAFGLMAVLLSFGKGLVWFTPGLFSPLARESADRLAWVQRALLWYIAGLVVVYAQWWAWYGGAFWGPRFFLAACVPASIALGSQLGRTGPRPRWQRALLVAAVALSFWVGVNGLSFDQHGLEVCFADGYALETLCHFTPEFSVLWHPFVDLDSAVAGRSRVLVFGPLLLWALACAWLVRDELRALVARPGA